MRKLYALILLFATVIGVSGQADEAVDRKARIRGIRDYAKQGQGGIPLIAPYLEDADASVRLEAARAIATVGGAPSLDPLAKALRDNDEAVQLRAMEGLVTFYMPGVNNRGLMAGTREGEVVETSIAVRPEIISGLGRLARGGISMASRAAAARSIGMLRGREALPDLYQALLTKDDAVLREALFAIQKIGDLSSGPRIQFLLRDLHEPVQLAAVETTGILKNREALSVLREVVKDTESLRVRRAALTAIAMMADESSRPIFNQFFSDKDDRLRGAAAEAFGRLRQPTDQPALAKAFETENKMMPRLSLAFALVLLGNHELSTFSPLQYLVNTLNSRLYAGSAEPLLVELAREAAIRQAIYPALAKGTRDEKMRLVTILAASGDRETLAKLEPLKNDPDGLVAREAARAAGNLAARLP